MNCRLHTPASTGSVAVAGPRNGHNSSGSYSRAAHISCGVHELGACSARAACPCPVQAPSSSHAQHAHRAGHRTLQALTNYNPTTVTLWHEQWITEHRVTHGDHATSDSQHTQQAYTHQPTLSHPITSIFKYTAGDRQRAAFTSSRAPSSTARTAAPRADPTPRCCRPTTPTPAEGGGDATCSRARRPSGVAVRAAHGR